MDAVPAPSSVRRPPSVLVVDDLADAADALALVLTLHGFAVRTAPDGQAALAAVAADPPDAVLTDLVMPRMDGWALARRVRGLYPGRRLLLVAVTGLAQDTARQRSAEAGFDLHLVKPVDAAALVAFLGRRLGSPGQEPADGGE